MALRDYLEENEDPRRELLARNHVGNVYEAAARAAGRGRNIDDHYGTVRHDFGDGTRLDMSPILGPKGRQWVVRWEGELPFWRFTTRTHMTEDELKDWLRTFPAGTRAQIVEASSTVRPGWIDREQIPHTQIKLDRKSEWISAKIAKIMKDGIRGKKVDQKQAAAVAYEMWGKKHGSSGE